MDLKGLLKGLTYEVLQGSLEININSVNYDSRKVSKDDVFVCIKGFASDGHKFANMAIEKGAKVIICQDSLEDIKDRENITIIKVLDTRKALALISANFYNNPTKEIKIVGITGTNGKTTTAFMMKKILESANKKVGLIGTIANYIGNEVFETERTTPESLELQKLFRDMANKNVEYCIMEVSSHSLELDRVYGIEFECGMFTNLTRDHLDFHKTFENYYKAKYKLFNMCKTPIVNIDDSYGCRVIEDLNKEGLNNYLTYAIDKEANIKALNIKEEKMDVLFDVCINGQTKDIILPIPGRYNIYNSLCAIGACKILGLSLDEISSGVKNISVPGRCERALREFNLPYEIIIDYAHTPDGLENVLKTGREFTKGRLISVFGCGGDRDKTKRPQMGEIGTRLSDIAIITSDNPRTEDEEEIIKDILEGVKLDNYIKITNRKEALKKAIEIAKKDDVIIIAGKGHETYQILKTGKIHFDEREIIKDFLENN